MITASTSLIIGQEESEIVEEQKISLEGRYINGKVELRWLKNSYKIRFEHAVLKIIYVISILCVI